MATSSSEPSDGAVCLPAASYIGASPFAALGSRVASFWLLFRHDGLANGMVKPNQPDDCISWFSVPFSAGQLVRVRQGDVPDDGLHYEPTIRTAAWCNATPATAAELVTVLPSYNEMARVYKRSAEDIAFWKAMIASPDDDLPRLVYADWLDEHGDPAARVLRDSRALLLHELVRSDGEWRDRNRVRIHWRHAVKALRRFAELGAFHFVELKPGYDQIILGRLTSRLWSEPTDPDSAWQCLSVTETTGVLPPMVSYLLLQLAVAPLLERLGCRHQHGGATLAEQSAVA